KATPMRSWPQRASPTTSRDRSWLTTSTAASGQRHIAVEALTGHTNVDASLDSLGHTRDIALGISHFAALPGLVAQRTSSRLPALQSRLRLRSNEELLPGRSLDV